MKINAYISYCKVYMYVKPQARAGWTFLSNHAHVLIALAHDSQYRVRDLAQLVGITERAVLQILSDLETVGVIKRHRVGRRNTYEVDATSSLRHPLESHRTVADILAMAIDLTLPQAIGLATTSTKNISTEHPIISTE